MRKRTNDRATSVDHGSRVGSKKKASQAGAVTPERNTKVRVNMYLDLEIVEFFKELARKPGAAAYQTQINSVLRQVVEDAKSAEVPDVATNLRQAKTLIDAALGKIKSSRRG